MSFNPQHTHSVGAGVGGFAVGGGGSVCSLSAWFLSRQMFRFILDFQKIGAVSFPFFLSPGEASRGEEHRLSVVPWGAERTVTSILAMVPIAAVAPKRPVPEGHRERCGQVRGITGSDGSYRERE